MNVTPWHQCGMCGKIVKINKPIFGSLHLCLTAEERASRLQIDAQRQMMFQRTYQAFRFTAQHKANNPDKEPKDE